MAGGKLSTQHWLSLRGWRAPGTFLGQPQSIPASALTSLLPLPRKTPAASRQGRGQFAEFPAWQGRDYTAKMGSEGYTALTALPSLSPGPAQSLAPSEASQQLACFN